MTAELWIQKARFLKDVARQKSDSSYDWVEAGRIVQLAINVLVERGEEEKAKENNDGD